MTQFDIALIIIVAVAIALIVFHNKRRSSAPIFTKLLPSSKNLVNIMFITPRNKKDQEIAERVKKIFFDGDIPTANEFSSIDSDIERVDGKRERYLLEQISSELMMRDVYKRTPSTGEENNVIFTSYEAEFATAECKNDVPFIKFEENREKFLKDKPMNRSDLKSFCKIGEGKFTLKRLTVEAETKTTRILSVSNIDAYASFEENGILLSMKDGSAFIVNFYMNGHIQKNEMVDFWNVHDEKIQTLYALDAIIHE